MTALTDQQRRFALEYLANGGNATQAAISAGYSDPSAKGCKLLKLAKVKTFLAEETARAARIDQGPALTAQRVLGETMRIAFSDLRLLFNDDGSLKSPHEWPDDVAAAVAGVEVLEEFEGRGKDRLQIGWTKKVRLWDKPRALELLGKHLKLWTEVVEAKVDGMDDSARANRAAALIGEALNRRAQATA